MGAGFSSHRRRIRTIGLIATVGTFVFAGMAVAAVSSPTQGLLVSASPDMSAPRKLSRAQLQGANYVFVSAAGSGVASVKFYVDDPNGNGSPVSSLTTAPFATPISALAPGVHTMLAVITDSSGKVHDLFARFTSVAGTTTAPTTRVPAPPTTGAPAPTTVPTIPVTAAPPAPTGPTVFVAPTGDDSNPGTSEAAPKLTIGGGLAAANPGDTVLVAPGTYDGNLDVNKGGTAGSPITLRSATKYGAIINGNGDTSKQSAVELNSAYVRIQDFAITGAMGVRNGILINADNVEIVGNEIHTICQFLTDGTSWKGGAGIDISISPSTNILIDSNVVHDIGAPGSTQELVHGMYLSSQVTNGRVTNNVIYRVEDFGLHPYDETEASGWQFINNTIANTGRGILQAPNGITRNNIVYNTRGARYDIRGAGNVVSDNIGSGTGDGGQDGVTEADPMFVDPSKDDYRLQPGSPAIDKGTATDAPALDIIGKARPQGAGVDIGAFEQ